MSQGNTASPATWMVVSIPMNLAHKKKGCRAHLVTPISNLSCHLAGGLFVDDTDLFHLDMRVRETLIEAHGRLQDAVINWGKLLIATGGGIETREMLVLPYVIQMEGQRDMGIQPE
jgi:hypothetical protein